MANDPNCDTAVVTVGSYTISSPHVKSFTVTRQRGTLWASASATLEIPGGLDTRSSLGGDFIIEGGGRLLFTGFIYRADSAPLDSKAKQEHCLEGGAGRVVVSVSGYDRLYALQGQKVTRRSMTQSLENGGESFCLITGLSGGGPSKTTVAIPEQRAKFTVSHGGPLADKSDLGTVDKLDLQHSAAGIGGVGGGNIVAGVPTHSHTSFSEGGPAVGVFGDYKLYSDR